MAIVINENQQELIEKYQVHLESEKKLSLLVKVLKENHKHFLPKFLRSNCKICKAMEKING